MWVAETKRGAFEAETLRELSNQIAEHYADDDNPICDIKEIHWQNNSGICSTLSPIGLSEFVEDCEEFNAELIQSSKDEAEYRREVVSDYLRSVL